MKAAEADLLILPDCGNADDDHWQTRWERKLSTARRVVQDDWACPDMSAWVERIVEAVGEAERPVVFLAHGLGIAAMVHAAPNLDPAKLAAGFLVAPVDVEDGRIPETVDPALAPLSRDPLPFPSMLVASRSDPACSFETADDLGHAWGSFVIDAGDVGHLDSDSGHGPWPEGSLTFARFLSSIRRA
ncbi:RBBP9/YdeN family alpha/beta hydrolase [Rhodobium gokarnense]|uniref:Alpha/beta hydrolase family esterase n=1 Tax=Rhodobium gokarnense TaxID=364296 RepID=A0ABT3HDH3_9HYPH|nr:alpha/beta hydrolase [Rhodobium gokarnense]MCW2308374.1 putative alpha/beta hydrolase family esterase [Rhodobium gokarnense]